MTAALTRLIESAVSAQSYTHLGTAETFTVLMLLLVLLVEKEILRAIGTAQALAGVRIINAFAAPLCAAFIVIVSVRMLYFLSKIQ